MSDFQASTSESSTSDRFYRWELLAMLFCAFFLHQGDRAIYGVVLPAIQEDLHLSDSQLGLVGSSLFFTLAVLMPLTGYLGDIWSRKWLITASVTFWSMATMVTGLARGMFGLIAFRSIATAGGESFYAPAAYSLLAQFHKQTRSFAMAVHQASLYLGVMSSGFLGGFIANRWGWRWAFYVYGACGILLGILLAFRLKNSPRPKPSQESPSQKIGPKESLSVLFRTPTACMFALGFAAIVFVNNAYVVWAPMFLQKKFHLPLDVAGNDAMLYHHLAALGGILLGGRLSDAMMASRRTFRLELQTVAMLLGVPSILLMSLSSSLPWTLAGMTVLGLCRGVYECNTHASLFDVIAPRYRGSAVAMMTMVAFLFGSTSPWFLGYCSHIFTEAHALSHGFAVLSIAYLVGGLAILTARLFTFRGDMIQEVAASEK